MKRFLMLAMALASARSMTAQSSMSTSYIPLDSVQPPQALAAQVTIDRRDVQLRDVMNEIAKQAGVSIVFDPSLPGMEKLVTVHADKVSSARVITRVLSGTPIQAVVSPAGAVVLVAHRHRAEEWSVLSGVAHSTTPLDGVHITLKGTRFETTTSASGQFTLGRVPPGDYQLVATRIGFIPTERAVAVERGADATVDVPMSSIAVPLSAVIVTPGYFGVMQVQIGASQALTRTQIETVPQLGEDVYRAIARLPGIATTDFSAKFAVRGEPGDELLVTLDGLPLVEPFHLKDLGDALSIVDLASLGGAELITGGPSAEYGDQLAGVFRLHTLEPRVDKARTSVGLSLTNLRAMSQGGFAGGKGGWLVSGRRGYLDLTFKISNLADSIYPRYNDLFGKITYALPDGGRLALHALRAGDALRYQDSREPRLDSRYSSGYVWATAATDVGARLRNESVLWFGSLDWRRVGEGSFLNRNWPLVDVVDARRLHTIGLRQDWSIDLGARALLKLGADVRHETAVYDYTRRLRRQVVENHAFVITGDSASIDMRPSNDVVGLYVSQRVRPVDALTLEAGLRYDRADATDDAVLGPRLNAAWQPAAASTVRVSWGDYAQRQSIFSLQVPDGVQTYTQAEHAKQLVVGWEQGLGRGLTARIEGYDRSLYDMRPRYVNATTAINVFPELAYDRVYVAPTEGRSHGVELSLGRQSGRTIDWNANYVLSEATHVVNGVRVPRANDQRQSAHLDWSAHPANNKWRFTISGLWHSGWPYTPDLVRIDTIGTAAEGQYAYPTWGAGALYSQRLQSYHRLDARWTRFFDTRSGRVAFFVDVYNALNTANVRDHYTNVNINRLAVRYFDDTREQLPRIPSFGINWEF